MNFIRITSVWLLAASAFAGPDVVKTANGKIEGTGPQASGVREFRGIPFAAPPLGKLRWAAPQPAKDWPGVRKATDFGPRCMQQAVFGDMGFRSGGMSEDCLYLNVWTPAKAAGAKLPVMVYFFGGGFVAGDGSEPRYDGESVAAKGIVTVTISYRLGVFGLMSHPELTRESPHHASGNYTLLDMNAALEWVRKNIAAFGGDPAHVTIAGESAGSIAVSAQMASPLSKGLFAGAIGESGSIMGALPPVPLADGEAQGAKFGAAVGAPTIAELRAMPADKLLEAAGKQGMPRFSPTIDGYFLPEAPAAIFAAGKQSHVPLLAGWNSEEQGARSVLARDEPTLDNFRKAVTRLYGDHAAEVLKEYAPASNDEVTQVATDLASDRFIAFSTWKWIDAAGKTGGKPVYRYFYSRPRPRMSAAIGNVTAGLAGGVVKNQGPATNAPPPAPKGAVHSAEIEYALGNLATNKVYDWTPEDYKVSRTMENYFANFIRTFNPNSADLPKWPASNAGGAVQFLRIDAEPRVESEAHRGRYLLMDKLAGNP